MNKSLNHRYGGAELGIAVALLIGCLVWAAIVFIPKINAWEKANGYPYGHLCDLYRTCDAR